MSQFISIYFVPPLQLDPNYNYGLVLLSSPSYNSIRNVEKESEFYFFNDQFKKAVIEFPEGSLEIGYLEYHLIGIEQKKTRSILHL